MKRAKQAYLAVMLAGWMGMYGTMAAEGPRLGPLDGRFEQSRFDVGVDLLDVRQAGLAIFATPFNHEDGFGDGPIDVSDTLSPGGRPTLGNNGTFLRVNGLDAQACMECHATVSSRSIPPRFGIGGFGGLGTVPILQPTVIDVSDLDGAGFAFLDGRLIVPPHLFGAGAVQLLAEEMTATLASQRAQALAQPGTPIALTVKGVDFGVLVVDAEGNLDTSAVHGVDDDLIVKPFGRKGEFATVRDFDLGAMQFHFGMQPEEIVGPDVDADGDGVSNELLTGEMSALEIFLTTMDRPWQEPVSADAIAGFFLFNRLECGRCHRPALTTESVILDYRTSLDDVAYFSVDLSEGVRGFPLANTGGLFVPLYSDLKRHDMGPGLAESFHAADARRNAEFVTPRLWGVADSAPYLHDGRALTIDEAIDWHGGEAEDVRAAWVRLSEDGRDALRAFLLTLRLPQSPNQDVLAN